MILTGTKIRTKVEQGVITIDPFEPKHLNSASIDLTLGDRVAVYEDWTDCSTADEWARVMAERAAGRSVSCGEHFAKTPYDGSGLQSKYASMYRDCALDTKKPAKLREWRIDPKAGWLLLPGVGYLMHTVERVHTDHYVPVLDGKSSIGRLFVQVHVTAGFGDPGFNGQYTLEVTSKFPVLVYPDMRICQMRFHHFEGVAVSYQKLGHYTGDKAEGPVGSEVSRTSFE